MKYYIYKNVKIDLLLKKEIHMEWKTLNQNNHIAEK